MAMLKFLFVLGVLAVGLTDVLAVSSKEKIQFQVFAHPHVMECSAKHGLTMDYILKTKEYGTDGQLDNCFKACFYKKTEMIDDHGLFVADKAKELVKNVVLSNDEKKAIEIISNCKSVNEAKVNDGEKGCERAGLLYECFRPLKATFQ